MAASIVERLSRTSTPTVDDECGGAQGNVRQSSFGAGRWCGVRDRTRPTNASRAGFRPLASAPNCLDAADSPRPPERHESKLADRIASVRRCTSTTAACYHILRARVCCLASLLQEIRSAASVSDVIHCISKFILIFANKLHDEGLHYLRQ